MDGKVTHNLAYLDRKTYRCSQSCHPPTKEWMSLYTTPILWQFRRTCQICKRSQTCWINVHRKLLINEMQYLHRLPLPKYTPLKTLRYQSIAFWWIWKTTRNIFPIPEPETDFGMAQGRFELWKQRKPDVELLVSIAETALEVPSLWTLSYAGCNVDKY